MVRFACDSRDRTGRSVERTVEAGSRREAIALLERDGLFPVEVRELAEAARSARSMRPPRAVRKDRPATTPAVEPGRRVPPRELRSFSLQLASSMRAGVPLIAALESIARQTEHRRFAAVVLRLADDVRGGESLSAAIEKHPRVFGEVYGATVAAGEQAGSLDEVLDYLATFLEDRLEVRSDVRSALMYPAVVVFALFAAITVLLVFVVPRFAKLYAGFGQELPLPTRILIGTSTALVEYLVPVLLVAGGLGFAFVRFLRTDGGRSWLDGVLLRVPIVRRLVSTSNTVQVTQLLGLFTRAGVPLMQGLHTISRAASSTRVREDLRRVAVMVGSGRSLASSLEEVECLSPSARQMIATGEESGSLERSCEAVARHLRSELRYLTKNLGTLIEPLLTGMLAVLVLGVALAVFLPMWDMVTLARQ